MNNLKTVEIKTLIPAKNFSISQQFYCDMGFEMRSVGHGIAYFCFEHCAFLLQDFYVKTYAENFMMHLLVEDIETWYLQIKNSVASKYEIKLSAIQIQPWRMKDFHFIDPSGVLWRIGQNI